MVQALLNSIKNMLGSQATQTKEFKIEAVKSNRNISVALKDIYKMFSATKEADSRNSISLGNIETSTAATSDKVDRSNSLLRESISLQTEMITELKGISRSILALSTGNNTNLLNQNQQNGGIGAALSSMAKMAGIGLAAGGGLGLLNNYFGGVPGTGSNSSEGFAGSGVGSSENAAKALEFFKQKGWSPEQAAGLVGNLQAESSKDLNPSAVGDGGMAYGIAQWHPDRQANFENQFGKSIRQSTFEEQLAFIQWELENTERKAGSLLRNATSAAEAAIIVDKYYERSKGIHRQQRISNANSLVEGDDSGTYTTASTGPQNDAMNSSGGRVVEKQAGIRRLPINSRLKGVLEQAAAAAGVDVEVFSGGQPRQGEGGQRTGSTRHDHGNAADVYLYREGRKLRDPEDREIMAKFVSAAAAAGATGIGFGGPGQYMGESGIHIGFGKPATWGGSPWIASAASGVYSNRDLQMENTDTSGSYASLGGVGSGGMGGGAGGVGGVDSGALLATLGAYFGMSFGGASSISSISNLFNSGFDEKSEQEPSDMVGRSAGPGGVLVNSKDKISSIENDNQNFETKFSKIQTAAIEDKKPTTTNDPRMTAYSAPPQKEISTDFGAMASPGSSKNTTRADWAPRIAVLRPDDDVTKPLTWAARIKGYA